MLNSSRAGLARLSLLSEELETLQRYGTRFVTGALPDNWLERIMTGTSEIMEQTDNKETMPENDTLDAILAEVTGCEKCSLATTRTKTVFGVGSPSAKLMFIGEAPGADEDKTGEPFVGRAGKLLTDMILAMGLSRDRVYIANILKCRPPDNRNPLPGEVELCEPYLKRQIRIIRPAVICTLGAVSAQTLLKTNVAISKLRGKFHSYEGTPLLPTYHPAYLLRNPSAKKATWEDLKMVMDKLGISIPGK